MNNFGRPAMAAEEPDELRLLERDAVEKQEVALSWARQLGVVETAYTKTNEAYEQARREAEFAILRLAQAKKKEC